MAGCSGGGKTDSKTAVSSPKTKTDSRKTDSQYKSPAEPKVEDIKPPVEKPSKKTNQDNGGKPTQDAVKKPPVKPSAGSDDVPNNQPASAADPIDDP